MADAANIKKDWLAAVATVPIRGEEPSICGVRLWVMGYGYGWF